MPRASATSEKGEIQSAVSEYVPAKGKTQKVVKTAERPKISDSFSHSDTFGARVTPSYAQRTPQMWPVSEVDIRAIGDDALVANVSFAIGSFCLGSAVNIFVDYGGAEKLTDLGSFMLHKGTVILLAFSAVFYLVGIAMNRRKNAIWDQIKRESKVVNQ